MFIVHTITLHAIKINCRNKLREKRGEIYIYIYIFIHLLRTYTHTHLNFVAVITIRTNIHWRSQLRAMGANAIFIFVDSHI